MSNSQCAPNYMYIVQHTKHAFENDDVLHSVPSFVFIDADADFGRCLYMLPLPTPKHMKLYYNRVYCYYFTLK